ncbi:uncharacterized protein [Parasteatoda tepidariorum]|uniref:uncharacterized protein n=1 Tax=Parasteatoda tepidariorum TaxID=114398 RepID=UPI0039BC8778
MASFENKEFLCSWKIENYSFAFQRYGQYIMSPLFRVNSLGGSEWSIFLYPRGCSETSVDSVACKLYRYKYNKDDESEDKITIDLRFELCNSNDIIVKVCEIQNQEIHRGDKSKDLELIKIRELQEEMELWPTGTLILSCYLIKTHDVLPLMPNEFSYSRCEALTEFCLDNFKHTSIIIIPKSREWLSKKKIIFPDMSSVEINCKVVGDEIRVEIWSRIEKFKSRFISCIVTFLDSKGVQILSKKFALLISDASRNLAGIVHGPARSVPNNDIKMNIEISSTNNEVFSTIEYFKEDLGVIDHNKLQSTQLSSESHSNECQASTSNSVSLFRLQSHLKNMLTDSKFTDVVLKADNEVIPSHKALLAVRSPVFSAMFERDMLESKNGVVEIHDVESKTLKLFLEYLYSGTVDKLDVESAKNLLVVADKYEVLSLKEMCSGYLESVLSLNNVCDVLSLSDMVNDISLKSAAIDYVVKNSLKVLPSTEWSTWVEHNVKLASEIVF